MAIVTKNLKQNLSTPAVTMLAIASIASPIGMVIMAQYGISSIFYYALVILAFFIPSTLVFAELGSAFPQAGGIYNWVKQAFGKKIGNIALWSQWLGVIMSFPIILSFTLSILLYPFDPSLIKDGKIILIGSLALLVLAVISSLRSIKSIAIMSYLATIVAIFIPVILLVTFAITLLVQGHPSATPINLNTIIPNLSHLSTFALIGATIFMFAGIELTANCMNYMKHPNCQYPKAIIWATLILSIFAVLGTLAIAVIIPTAHTSLVAGLIQAFVVGAAALHITWLPYVMAIAICVAQICIMSIYLISLAKGIQASAADGLLPSMFSKENRRGIPVNTILTLSLIAVLISLAFILMPSVHSAYWLIEAVVIVGSSLRYLLCFTAAIVLRYTKSQTPRPIRIPGGNLGMWIMAGLPLAMVAFAIAMTFIPPPQFSVAAPIVYDIILASGASLFIILPLATSLYNRKTTQD